MNNYTNHETHIKNKKHKQNNINKQHQNTQRETMEIRTFTTTTIIQITQSMKHIHKHQNTAAAQHTKNKGQSYDRIGFQHGTPKQRTTTQNMKHAQTHKQQQHTITQGNKQQKQLTHRYRQPRHVYIQITIQNMKHIQKYQNNNTPTKKKVHNKNNKEQHTHTTNEAYDV